MVWPNSAGHREEMALVSKTVAITEVGCSLHAEAERLVLRHGGHIVQTFLLAEVDQVLLFGPVEVTHHAIMALLRAGADLVFLTSGGSYRGRLIGRASRQVELRVAQYDRLRDPDLAFAIARAIVTGKIRNQRHQLLRAQSSLGDDTIAQALARLRFLAIDAQSARDREELLGIEGAAAAAYFPAFGRAIKNPLFSFSRRTRRPPRDPVNACLSFGYTLLGTMAEGEAAAAGLDPMLGAFHQPEYGRPSLALDLIEELRSVIVDAVTLRLINRRQLVPDDFASPAEALGRDQLAEDAVTPEEGVYLALKGRKIFLSELLKRLREEVYYPPLNATLTWREILRQQTYHLARVIRGQQERYVPFEPR